MALLTDVTLNFPVDGAGYTFNAAEIEFIGGVGARLKSSFGGGISTIETVDISMAARGQIDHISITAIEELDYFHYFYVSFDGGAIWNQYDSRGWSGPQVISDLENNGITRDRLPRIREWPTWDKYTTVRFLIGLKSVLNVSQGAISLITIHYAAKTANTAPSYSGTGDGTLNSLTPGRWTRAQDWEIKARGAGPVATFEVTGSLDGHLADIQSGAPGPTHPDPLMSFSITDGATPFAADDGWEFSTTRPPEVLTVEDEPLPIGNGEPFPNGTAGGPFSSSEMIPSFSTKRSIIWPVGRMRTSGGYEVATPIASLSRLTYSLVWRSLIEADKDILRPFLESHRGTNGFRWTVPGESLNRLWVAESVRYQGSGPLMGDLTCDIIESIPAFTAFDVNP